MVVNTTEVEVNDEFARDLLQLIKLDPENINTIITRYTDEDHHVVADDYRPMETNENNGSPTILIGVDDIVFENTDPVMAKLISESQ